MENRIATTIDQSKKLLELGIDVNTADMLWVEDCDHNFDLEVRVNVVESYNPDNLIIVPAWSLTALLGLLSGVNLYKIGNKIKIENAYRTIRNGISLIDAAFEMVVWLKENNKI